MPDYRKYTDEGNSWASKAAWTAFWASGGTITAMVLWYLRLIPVELQTSILNAMKALLK